jgi:hypothetical protein
MTADAFTAALAERMPDPSPDLASPPAPRPPAAPPPASAPEFLRLNEAAKLARVSEPTLRAWGKRGLRIHSPARRVRLVRRADLIAFIEGGPRQ